MLYMPLIELTLSSTIMAILALLAGIVVIVWKRSLNIVVGGWLILYGVLQLLANLG